MPPSIPRLLSYPSSVLVLGAALGSSLASVSARAQEMAEPPEQAERPTPAPLPTARRAKPLQFTVGAPPSSQDLGSEADLTSQSGPTQDLAAVLGQWSFVLKGSVRVPMRVGIGPRNDGRSGRELHSPPRIVGLSSGDWNYVALAPNASAGLTLQAGNPLATGTLIFKASHLIDPGYHVTDDTGLDSAYLTLKFPDAFGSRGGFAVLAGVFSERFGMSGRYQKSSGHYSTYLFGRTHQAGESVTFDIDITPKVELLLENGVGAKTDVVPFLSKPPEADFIQGQGPQPYGSTFVHHSHASVIIDNWLRFSGHYLMSWSPDDNSLALEHAPLSRLVSTGGEVHADSENLNAYVGYSHIDGQNLFPLGDALQVLHSGAGRAFKLNYFGQKGRLPDDDPRLQGGLTPSNVAGTLDTILWEAVGHSAFFGDPFGGRDLNVGIYGMFNVARSPVVDPNDKSAFDIHTYKLKLGVDAEIEALRFMSVALRADRVIPKLGVAPEDSDAYTALSPRLTFHTRPGSKEHVHLQYTHFFLGPRTVPGSPYTDGYYKADPDMVVLTGRMSF